jgi:lia operon protein LiaG
MLRKIGKICGAALGLLMVWVGVPGYAWDELSLVNTETVSLAGTESLSIEYGSGGVILRESDSEDLVIREYMKEDRPRYYVRITRSGGTVRVREGRRPWLNWFWKVRTEIDLPRSFRGNLSIANGSGSLSGETDLLNYKTVDVNVSSGSVSFLRLSGETVSVRVSSGDLDITGIGGNSFISVSSGNLRIGQLAGPEHRVKISSGRTAIEKAQGRIELNIASGSAAVGDFSGEGSFEMSSGRITLDMKELAGDLRFTLSSGSAELNLPGGLPFTLDAVTRSGKVLINEGGAEVLRVSGDSTVLRPFAGAADPGAPERTIRARLNSGTVVINRR